MIEYLAIGTRSLHWGESIMLQRTMSYVLLSCLLVTNALSATSKQSGIKHRALELVKNKKTKIAAGATALATGLLVVGYQFHRIMVEKALAERCNHLLDLQDWACPANTDEDSARRAQEQDERLRIAEEDLAKVREKRAKRKQA
jgi:hypothetical protein